MSGTRSIVEESAQLTIATPLTMRHSSRGSIHGGIMDCGDLHGFLEAGVETLRVEDVGRAYENVLVLVKEWGRG